EPNKPISAMWATGVDKLRARIIARNSEEKNREAHYH
ncbi:MAG: hypothetical protein RLZZ608_482, partial [Actinomycetota bacterium]